MYKRQLKLGGLEHFLTQKMSWSQFNRFPYSTFRWRGIDGTEVLTHFPPEDTYNSQLQPYDLQKTERNFVEKGVLEQMQNGVLAGYPMIGIRASIVDGSFHDVDSSEMAFKIAASMALREAVLKANPIVLEPIMMVEVVTPDEHMGDVVGDLNKRRGVISGMDENPSGKIVKAAVPLSEMFGYSTDLRSKTQGRATYTMEFSRYEEIPSELSDEIRYRA